MIILKTVMLFSARLKDAYDVGDDFVYVLRVTRHDASDYVERLTYDELTDFLVKQHADNIKKHVEENDADEYDYEV